MYIKMMGSTGLTRATEVSSASFLFGVFVMLVASHVVLLSACGIGFCWLLLLCCCDVFGDVVCVFVYPCMCPCVVVVV